MAFLWSRLALAAVLAAGAACAPAEACPDDSSSSCDECGAPQLACADGVAVVFLRSGRDGRYGLGDTIIADAPAVAHVPRVAITIEHQGAHAAPAATSDVLVVAPKTSPPQT